MYDLLWPTRWYFKIWASQNIKFILNSHKGPSIGKCRLSESRAVVKEARSWKSKDHRISTKQDTNKSRIEHLNNFILFNDLLQQLIFFLKKMNNLPEVEPYRISLWFLWMLRTCRLFPELFLSSILQLVTKFWKTRILLMACWPVGHTIQ